MDISVFREIVYGYYREHKRSFPWRDNPSPYGVFISEVMLQQTQAGTRTIEKFNSFMARFPSFESLASASLRDVLFLWQGLGYNRRALALKKAAEIIVRDYNGVLPQTLNELDALPGIGPATACSISAFAFNKPVTFIETNIRSVFIHHFFPEREAVADSELLPLIEQALDAKNSREWYSALMDYGSSLKKRVGNESRRSKHYTKQSTFEGSDRQIRGMILNLLSQRSFVGVDDIYQLNPHRERMDALITTLIKEGMLVREGASLRVA